VTSDEGRNAAGGWPPRSPEWWCPRPERWHSDNDDAAEHEVSALAAAFVTALQPDVVVETGSHTGQTAKAIGQALARNGHGMLYTVETEQPFAEQAARNCQGLPVTVIHGDSQGWLRDPGPPGPVGFAWIDGLWEHRAPDLEALLPHFSPGAIAGIHDTGPQFPWVQQALAPLAEAGKIRLLDLRTPRGVSFAQVLSA
jgi:methyltransferase family protein